MKKELEQKFQADFPNMFRNLYGDPAKTCLAWGIECSDGWFDLIYKLCQDIQAAGVPDDFEVEQVKEKFGGLRFYISRASDEANRLIAEAEIESYKTCESCGSKQDVTVEGSWVQTLCNNCRHQGGLQ